jgi:L-iditol 2-dehydrogenase
MKTLIYNPQEITLLSVVDKDKPKLNNHNAIIQVLGVGICGSDLLKLNRGLVPKGSILGHEIVGIVKEISTEISES